MNGTSLNSGIPRGLFASMKFEGFEVSCVAPNPFGAGFAFGSHDGRLKFTDEAGTLLFDMNGSPSGEAINGIASFRNVIAVSSRQEVTLRTWTEPENLRHIVVATVPYGAHGVSATQSGYFIAPLGHLGIMLMKANSGEGDLIGVMGTENESVYFYRVLACPGRDGRDLLICAARRGGIGIAEIGDSTHKMWTIATPEFDAMDVCVVGGEPQSPAVAAVGLDGTLLFVRDMLNEEKPLTMKFKAIKGRAYRLLSVRGHLFILTSSALYGLMNLGTQLMEGRLSERFITPIFVVPMEAVDAAVVGDRWLPVVMPDEVLLGDLNLIHDSTPKDLADGEIRHATGEMVGEIAETIDRQWDIENIATESRDLTAVA